MTKRNHWIDNLKLFLTLTVITHHAAIAYGAEGLFGLNHLPDDPVSPLILTLFVALNQSYFMGLFFFLSALFSPSSIDRDGPQGFLKKRVFRLGLPLLISVVFIRPLIDFIIILSRGGEVEPYPLHALHYLRNWDTELGPLWFVAALLLFHTAYALIYAVREKKGISICIFPAPCGIVFIIMISQLAILGWLIRIYFPVGKTIIFGFQPAHFAQYILAYRLGIAASRGEWLERLKEEDFRIWRRMTPLLLVLLPVFVVSAAAAGFSLDNFMGNGTFLSLSYTLFEGAAFFSFSLTLILLFQKKLNHAPQWLTRIHRESFFVYFIHELCLIALIGSYLRSSLPSFLLFLIVTVLGIITSYSLSFFLRRLPVVRSVF